MDTATHFAMGFGLAALAHLDPVVASSPELAQAVMLGTVIGQQAPDLDGFTRLFGHAAYVRNHRGVSHSVPAIFLWTFATFGLIQFLQPQDHWGHLIFWILLAVFLHVFVDLFNSYGTKGLSPFNRKWIAFDVIFIFDAFIFGMHMLGFLLWMAGAEPGSLFLMIYLIIAAYYVKRFRDHRRAKELIQSTLPVKGDCKLIPTAAWHNWTFLIQSDTHWHVGELMNGNDPLILDTFVRKPENDLVKLSKTDKKVNSFLSFTSYAHVEVKEQPFGYEVRWFDLRYRAKRVESHYMFVAVVYIDKQMQIRDSYIGWIHRGEEQLAKKLNPEKG
ncbi:metal-dependent hydrolase [Brevibacillus dissolubilis]|uniref:metal-dependent hydrolase n=1 Tax=Brevibacillus dissolubilis TaxID=1844116 RepID=UPI001115EB8E|nr:metal-dependent hydrolase [Brevibacillus dissolubilis]